MKLQRSLLVLALSTLLAGTFFLGAPSSVEAQAANENESSVQGTIGLGMVGAEAGLVVAGAVDSLWAYLTFPILGGAGGAVGGYFLLDEPNRVEGSVAVLAAGMGLLIPAIVLTLVLASSDPGDDIDDEEMWEESESEKHLKAMFSAGPGLLRLVDGQFHLAPPGLTVGMLSTDLPGAVGRTAAERTQRSLDLAAQSDAPVVHLPLVSGAL